MSDIPVTYYKAVVRSQKFNPVNPPSLEEPPPVLNPPGSGSEADFVTYENASRDVNLGSKNLLANSLTLDPTPATIPTAQGSIYFDADEETIAAILNGTVQKIGEDMFFQVKNQSGVSIPKGTSVRFDGVVGASGRIKVVPFLADGTYPSMYFVGILNEELLDGGDGKAYYGGKIRGLNTNAYTVGTILYCSTTVAGGFQSTAPIAPNNIISVAAVIAQSATVGALLIRPQIGSNINSDEGVKIVDVQNGDILKYNESTGLFENTPETGSTKDGLISGGLVQWTGTGFVFNVSRALARFSQIELDSLVSSQVTLAASHATLNRRDVFILQVGFDGAGTPISITPDKITGTASASPVKPQINPLTQIELTDILVIAASTTPTLTTEVIYDENIEWVGSYTGTGTVVFNSAANPFQGPFSIEATNIENNLRIRLTRGSDFNVSTVQTLGKQIDLKATMFAGQNIGVTFLDSSANPISSELILNLDKSLTTYQFLGEALSQFNFTSFLARSIEFRYIRTKGTVVYSGFYLDIIKLEGGINPPQTVGSFLGLSDVFAPTGYSGQASKVVSVKTDESGLEFVTGGGGGISGLTVNELVYGDTASSIASLPVATYPSLTEFSYMKGVTSAVQTQINGKQATIAGTLTDTYVATIVAGVPTWQAPSAGASNWTVVGSDIYRNSSVSIGRTTIPTTHRLTVRSLNNNLVGGDIGIIRGERLDGTLCYEVTNAYTLYNTELSINQSVGSQAARLRQRTNDDTVASLRCENLAGTLKFEVRNLYSQFAHQIAVTGTASDSQTLRVRSGNTNRIALFESNAGTSVALINNSGDFVSRGRIISGGGAFIPTFRPDAMLQSIGDGVTTELLRLESSARTIRHRFYDNGRVEFYALPTSSAGLPAGSLWNNSGVINIV